VQQYAVECQRTEQRSYYYYILLSRRAGLHATTVMHIISTASQRTHFRQRYVDCTSANAASDNRRLSPVMTADIQRWYPAKTATGSLVRST